MADSSRATMLGTLMDGEAFPSGELARRARVSPQTASSHLAKLLEGGLLVMEKHGRHRYYRLANAEVALAVEALTPLASPAWIRSWKESREERALHFARTCYDHLAGELGVGLARKLLELGFLEEDGRDYRLTGKGGEWFRGFGIDTKDARRRRRAFARRCLDWSEHQHHLAGSLGAALTARLFELGWIERITDGTGHRAVLLTEAGRTGLVDELDLSLPGNGSSEDSSNGSLQK